MNNAPLHYIYLADTNSKRLTCEEHLYANMGLYIARTFWRELGKLSVKPVTFQLKETTCTLKTSYYPRYPKSCGQPQVTGATGVFYGNRSFGFYRLQAGMSIGHTWPWTSCQSLISLGAVEFGGEVNAFVVLVLFLNSYCSTTGSNVMMWDVAAIREHRDHDGKHSVWGNKRQHFDQNHLTFLRD